MTNTKEIFDLIPRLRRFGRILINSQTRVDTLIQNCVQELISEEESHPTSRDDERSLRLFQLFLAALERTEIDAGLAGVHSASSQLTDELLERLTPFDRTIFLLRYVDQFSVRMTAKLLKTSSAEVMDAEHRMRVSSAGS